MTFLLKMSFHIFQDYSVYLVKIFIIIGIIENAFKIISRKLEGGKVRSSILYGGMIRNRSTKSIVGDITEFGFSSYNHPSFLGYLNIVKV